MKKLPSYAHLFKLEQRDEILRVDHAGELGAKHIYMGQLRALGRDDEILDMLDGEILHLEFFEGEIAKAGTRPSILNPLWQRCAFLLGFLGSYGFKNGRFAPKRENAMLVTAAVEDVISRHYSAQIDALEEGSLRETLQKFKEDEEAHKSAGEAASSPNLPLEAFTKFATHLGIFLSKKL